MTNNEFIDTLILENTSLEDYEHFYGLTKKKPTPDFMAIPGKLIPCGGYSKLGAELNIARIENYTLVVVYDDTVELDILNDLTDDELSHVAILDIRDNLGQVKKILGRKSETTEEIPDEVIVYKFNTTNTKLIKQYEVLSNKLKYLDLDREELNVILDEMKVISDKIDRLVL